MTVELDTTPPLFVNDRFFQYSGKRILCSGQRRYHTQKHGDFVARVLNEISPGFVLHGGDDGLDRWVQWWCLKTSTPFAIVPCHMQGSLRTDGAVHQQHDSLFLLEPDIVIAFPGVSENVLRQATVAGIPALKVDESMFNGEKQEQIEENPAPQRAMNPAEG